MSLFNYSSYVDIKMPSVSGILTFLELKCIKKDEWYNKRFIANSNRFGNIVLENKLKWSECNIVKSAKISYLE